jgi:peptidoglycan hydrolase-like protein with peptidoglycan-binding domain
MVPPCRRVQVRHRGVGVSSDTLALEEAESEGSAWQRAVAMGVFTLMVGFCAAIFYNTLFNQGGARLREAQGFAGTTRVSVEAGSGGGTVVLRVDPMIEALQKELALAGFYEGPVDGVYGQRTRAAIEAFQTSQGREPTGVATPELVDEVRYTRELLAASGLLEGAAAPEEVEALRRAQAGLAELGYLRGPADGILTEATRRAIAEFERDRGLPETGAVSEALLSELSKTTGTGSTSAPE